MIFHTKKTTYDKNIEIFLKYKDYLVSGTYISNCIGAKFEKEDSNILIHAYNDTEDCKKRHLYTINEVRPIFDGELLLIPSTSYGVKIFSKNQVLTFYNNKNIMHKIIDNKEWCNYIFNTPITIEYGENFVIEEFIKNKPEKDDEKIAFFMNAYITFFKKDNTDITIAKHENKRLKYALLFKNFYKKISTKNYETIIQHGDMWSYNIIFNGEKFYVLDYENVSKKYILFDFFTYIYNEAIIHKNNRLLDKYRTGKYDDLLFKYMESLNLIFLKERREEYFKTFLSELLYEKMQNYGPRTYIKELLKMKKTYNSFMKGYGK